MISDDRLPLEVVWPEVHRRLLRFLHGRGTDASTAEDIVQEVALRVVALDVPYESADDLMRWAATAARNLAIDQWRADARYGAVPLEETASAVDVDETVEHRLRLEAVGNSWMQLSERDRDALRSGALGTKASSRSESVRWAVQRHAARARLTAMIDGLSAALVWLGAKLRYRPRKPSRAALLASLPALFVVAVLLPHAIEVLTPKGPGDTHPPVRRAAERATTRLSPLMESRPASDVPPATRSADAKEGRSHASSGVVPYRRFQVGSNSGVHRYIATEPKRPDDSLVCLYNAPLLGSPCFNPPLPLPPLPVP